MRAHAALLILLAGVARATAFAASGGLPSAIMLADESVRFESGRPLFSANQLANSAEATRAGLARWAATERGRDLLLRLRPDEYVVEVLEDPSDTAPGRAPQPGIATLAAASDHRKLKLYRIVVNPDVFHPVKATTAVVPPVTASDMMALAWAAEMLHIDFYSRGISLPHHRRDDFQREWLAIATELGMPLVRHEDDVEEQPVRRDRRSRPRFGEYR
ncbi:MAG TPA: hypothetical protein VF190_10875 [Rhodothermales bacterium]